MNNAPHAGLISWFATNPVTANLLLILVIILGALQLGQLRKEAFPSLSPNKLTISVSYDSGSAQQSEEGLSIKIEDQLEEVLGIKSITSTATATGATLTIEKRDGYDLDVLLRDVKNKIDAISNFPALAEKPVIEKAQREEHALWLQLYGDTDRRTLQQLADELKTDLLAHNNVNRVSIQGRLDPVLSIEIDEGRLQAHGLSLSAVQTAINQESTSTATAILRNESLYLQINIAEKAYQKEEFAAIPLTDSGDGRRILLGDIADIKDTFADDHSVLSRFNGHSSIALQVITTGQDDISDTITGAVSITEKWRANGKLPQGVELTSWYDRSTMIQERLQLLTKNALAGFAIVFLLLALFLNLKVALCVGVGLPFVFFGTLYFMGDAFAGLSLNEFTTFGFIMALGIVVDDAVVVGESVYSLRSEEGDTVENTIRGTLRVAVPTLFGALTTVAAFYAISQISGQLGELYSQFATVVAICLLLSVTQSKLILPAHLANLNTRNEATGNPLLRGWHQVQAYADRGLGWFNEYCYRNAIAWALHHRYAVILLFLTVLVLAAGMPFTGAVRLSFFPEIAGDTVRAELSMQTDAGHGLTHAALNRLETCAYETDRELGADAAKTGIANLQLLSEADQSGSVRVELSKQAPYDIDSFTRMWRSKVGIPEGTQTLSIQHTAAMVDALRIELRAGDDDTLTVAGREMKSHLESTPGVSGIEDNLEPEQPRLRIELTRQGRALGFTTDMLATQVLQAFSGQVAQRFQRNRDEVEVKVRYPDTERRSVTALLNTTVRTADGTAIPLPVVATTDFDYTRDTITRINGKRAVYISADVDKQLVSSTELVSRLQQQLVPQLERQYSGLDIRFAGEAEQQAETQSSMINMFLLALLIIYLLLAIPLKSYIQPLLIMTAIPFGIVGAILGHWLNDLSLGILSLNGIIALSGVVVNNSLLLVTAFNELRFSETDIHEAISRAGRSRLRAVLLTSLTTVAGLLPLLSETSMQAQFLIPAAVSLAYGIIFSTVITLILIPVLLLIQDDVRTLAGCLTQKFSLFRHGSSTC